MPLGSEAARIFWSGPILVRSRDELLTREEARRIIGAPADKKLVYVSLGGGGDEQAQTAFEIIEAAALGFLEIHLVVARGPLAPTAPPSRHRTSYVDWYPMMELFAAFDAAISAAGYNAFHELLYCGVPTVFLPQERGYDDQHRRARAARERGAAEIVEELSPGSLQRALSRVLEASVAREMKQRAQQMVSVNGAENAARAILELASGEQSGTSGRLFN
jgi:UDP:flavonoid glycosyltransferase YjiC (YdhE family)